MKHQPETLEAIMVRITNIETGRVYIARNISDCRDNTDKSGYETCREMGMAISMGKMVFEPVN